MVNDRARVWRDDDGRLFSAAAAAVIAATDPAYLAWIEAGNLPTPWPRDEAGRQTDAALQVVLDDGGYDLFVDLAAYAAAARWAKEVGGITIDGVPVATDDRSKILIAGAYEAAKEDAGFSTAFKLADGSRVVLGAVQIIAIGRAVRTHVALCFATEGEVVADLKAGRIATRADVDAAFASLSSAYLSTSPAPASEAPAPPAPPEA